MFHYDAQLRVWTMTPQARRRAWFLLVSVLVMIAAYTAWLRLESEARWDAYRFEIDAANAAVDSINAKMAAYMGAHARTSRADVEKEFNGGKPLLSAGADRFGDKFWWDMPFGKMGTVLRAQFQFSRDGFWRYTGPVAMVPVPGVTPQDQMVEAVRRQILWGAIVLWFVWPFAMLMMPRAHAAIAEGWLACSLIVCLGYAIAPDYWPLTVFDNDGLFFGVLMLVIGGMVYGIVFAHLRRARKAFIDKGTHCRQCGYNLKGNVSGTCPECGLAVECEPPPALEAPPSPA